MRDGILAREDGEGDGEGEVDDGLEEEDRAGRRRLGQGGIVG